MTVLNTSVRFHTRGGAPIRTAALSVFWSSLDNPDPFDPRCAYDPYSDRWIVISLANRFSTNSALLVGVSQSGDPTGQWHLRRIDRVGGETNWIDFPNLGFNRNWIVVQAAMKTVSGNQFAESQIYAFDKADLYAGGAGRFTRFVRRDIGPTQAAALTHDPHLPELYLVASPVDAPVNQRLQLFVISGSVGAENLSLARTFEASEPWGAAAPGDENLGPQRDSIQGIHLQDSSIQNVVFRNGSIWCAHHVFLPPDAPTRSAIQWWQLSTNAVLQRGRIDDLQFSFGYPSIAVNRHDDALIGYTRFGSNQFASANYSFRLATDPPNRFRTETVLKSGDGPYVKTRGSGKNRWGDYSSSVVDPVDDLTFWTIQEYAAEPDGDPTVDGSGRWGTWWGKIVPPTIADTDSDGLPDEWEIVHQFDPLNPLDAQLDSDGDRLTNRDEFLAGTDPRDAASVLCFTSVGLDRTRLNLTFPTIANRIYRLERSTSLSSSDWTEVSIIRGTGAPASARDDLLPSNTTAFYRLRLEIIMDR